MLESWPEENVRAVDVGVCYGNFASLKLEGEMLVESDTKENPDSVARLGDECFGHSMSKGEDWVEDFGDCL